ncbi:hypothetical protein GEMRC1_003500 [Eukaryota sp. GEM-RC1]
MDRRKQLELWRASKGRTMRRPPGMTGTEVDKLTPRFSAQRQTLGSSRSLQRSTKPIETPSSIFVKSEPSDPLPSSPFAKTEPTDSIVSPSSPQPEPEKPKLPPKTPRNKANLRSTVDSSRYGSTVVLAQRKVKPKLIKELGSPIAFSPVRRSRRLNPNLDDDSNPPPEEPHAYIPNSSVSSFQKTPRQNSPSPFLSGSAFRRRFISTPSTLSDDEDSQIMDALEISKELQDPVSPLSFDRDLEDDLFISPVTKTPRALTREKVLVLEDDETVDSQGSLAVTFGALLNI